MSNIISSERIKKNEAGFTFIELLMATVMSLIILGLLAHVFRSQEKEFSQQTGLNTMQANGRAATEFVARSVQNAGFNVHRGTRFLAASDHYLTAVYDASKDDVIQNDEVITYTLANTWSGSASDSFTFTAHYDVDGNGTITSSEDPDIDIDMTASGPPFHLYKVIPNQAGTDIERSMVARNIDNMVIRYYDKDGKLLPIMNDTDDDGVGDTVLDADDDGIPDNGNWTYQFPPAELNDIRKVEIDILARSRKPDPREVTHSGSYAQGSFAAVKTGGTSYGDLYNREDFTAQMAPRNLVMAPWGSVVVRAAPPAVDCPATATVTATLLDENGEPISGETVHFTATGGANVTVGTPQDTSDGQGNGLTNLTYDYSSPYFTSTISASAQVPDVNGDLKPIYSAAPVSFSLGAQGFVDSIFDGSQAQPWTTMPTTGGFDETATTGEFRSNDGAATVLNPTASLNGCAPWQDYAIKTDLKQAGLSSDWADNHFMGVILRYQDENNYYWARVTKVGTDYFLRVGKVVAGLTTEYPGTGVKQLNHTDIFGTAPTPYDFKEDELYTLKAQISGETISAKIWKQPLDPLNIQADELVDEPAGWDVTHTDTGTTFTNGRFGVLASEDQIFRFDDVVVENPEITS
jgi:Tfp pilus assembly protein PilV